MALRLFDPDFTEVSAKSSLTEFFQDWYQHEASKGRRAEATIERRADAMKLWEHLMRTPIRPRGPLVEEITSATLQEFAEKLSKHSYSRGGTRRYPYSAATQETILREVQNVLRAAGPAYGRTIRAGLITETPASFTMEKPLLAPPRIWNLEEATKIVKAIDRLPLPKYGEAAKIGLERFRALLRCTLALWAYTGCRSAMVAQLECSAISQVDELNSVLLYREQKTHKGRCVPVHSRLLKELQVVRQLFPKATKLIPWPVHYGAVADYHADLLKLDPTIPQKPPKYWRKWFARELQRAGCQAIQKVSQLALDHSAPTITALHYSDAVDLLIPRIPDFFDHDPQRATT